MTHIRSDKIYKICDVLCEIGRLFHNKRQKTTFGHPFEFRYLGIGLHIYNHSVTHELNIIKKTSLMFLDFIQSLLSFREKMYTWLLLRK
jgi:hypothetical protein